MIRIGITLVSFILVFLTLGSAQETATTTVPNLIRYSGTLKDSQGVASVPATTVGVTFAIYKQQDGGAPIWQETQSVTADLNGQYTVLLGTTTTAGLPDDLFSQQEQRWLGIQLQGEAEQSRVLMVSVPYAFKAHDAETLGGLPASAFVQATSTSGAGTTSNGTSQGTATTGSTGNTGKSGGGTDTVLNCTTAKNNYIPVFTSAAPPNIVICNSVMYQATNGNLGVGTTTPAAKFEVNDSNNPGFFALSGTTSNAGEVGTYGNNLATSGNAVGVAGHTLSQTGTGVYGFHDSTIGAGIGVSGLTNSVSGVGVLGTANTPAGSAYGVSGTSASTDGIGVIGVVVSPGAQGHKSFGVEGQAHDPNGAGGSFANLATSGAAAGVSAYSNSSNGTGVVGIGVAKSHTAQMFGNAESVGVWGDTDSGYGVFATTDDGIAMFAINNSGTNAAVGGLNQSTTGQAFGVVGATASTTQNASGVYGEATPATGATNGVYGLTNSTDGNAHGVYGKAAATTGGASGVTGVTNALNGYGVWGIATSTDVSGSAYGVYGQSGNSHGVVGSSTVRNGVVGFAGYTSAPCCTNAIVGQNVATSGANNGGELVTSSPGGVGGIFTNTGGGLSILARVNSSQNSFWVDGGGNGWFAGGLQVNGNGTLGPTQINGNLNVTGTLTKGGGSFKIDDPLDPANKYLSHSFVESPDMMNIYNGSVKLNARGEAWVTMPDYFEALNRDFQYALTAIGRPQPYLYIAKKMSGNRFKIAGGKPNAEVSWQVTGIRQDAWANAYRIPVEEAKPAKERGTYLHPELFGADANKSVSAQLSQPQVMTQK